MVVFQTVLVVLFCHRLTGSGPDCLRCRSLGWTSLAAKVSASHASLAHVDCNARDLGPCKSLPFPGVQTHVNLDARSHLICSNTAHIRPVQDVVLPSSPQAMADPEGYGFPDDGAGDDEQSIISVRLYQTHSTRPDRVVGQDKRRG